MKKSIIIGILIFGLIIYLSLINWPEHLIPAPFSEAKKMALKAGLCSECGQHYIWKAEVNERGQKILYEISVFQDHPSYPNQIVLMKNRKRAVGYIYGGSQGPYYVMWSFEIGLIENVSKEFALAAASQFFKELVKNGLI